MLIMAIFGTLTPTLFYQIYGNVRIPCIPHRRFSTLYLLLLLFFLGGEGSFRSFVMGVLVLPMTLHPFR